MMNDFSPLFRKENLQALIPHQMIMNSNEMRIIGGGSSATHN
jgi:hypothetical protein